MGSSISNRRNMEDRDDSDSRERDSDTSDPDGDVASIFQYLIRSGQVRVITSDGNHEDSDEDFYPTASQPVVDPSPDTSVLDRSEFKSDILQATGRLRNTGCCRPSSVFQMVENRRVGMYGDQCFTRSDRCSMISKFLPKKMSILSKYNHKIFCGTYSQDGNLFLTACQDRNIRLYDTSKKQFRLFTTIQARDVGWSILDTAFSPDGNHLVYASWSECIHLCNIHGEHEIHEALPLCPDDRRFCIFSLVFSQDGREVLGGANDGCLYVYNIEKKERILRIEAHEDDVNTVAFADATSQILFSGGDDGLCKVWDRRTLSESDPKPVGILAGHMDGITYVDPRGDGRHLITNCKDQCIKLWDMRVFSPYEGLDNTRKAVASQHWDYRWQHVPRKLINCKKRLMGDTSLMTYCGHSVLQTLIRCHFSPEFTTGQRYIYTGCATGRVVVYDVLTGKIEATLKGHRACVRDVSWHPFRPEVISTSWDGMVARWSYEGQALDGDEAGDKNGCPKVSEDKFVRKTHSYSLRQRPGQRS